MLGPKDSPGLVAIYREGDSRVRRRIYDKLQ